jgi:hypothetical protein
MYRGKPYRTSLHLNSPAQISTDAWILTIVVTHFRHNWVEILSRILAARAAADRAVCDDGLFREIPATKRLHRHSQFRAFVTKAIVGGCGEQNARMAMLNFEGPDTGDNF